MMGLKMHRLGQLASNSFVSAYFSVKENTFLNTRVSGTNRLEKVGNFFLTPSQYLFGGKKITLVQSAPSKVEQICDYKKDKPAKEILKTIVAIIALIPSLIIGSALKGLAHLSKTTRERHLTVKNELYPKELKKETVQHKGLEAVTLFSEVEAPCQGHQVDGNSPKRHEYEVAALAEVSRVFAEQEIPWWVDCGTALGSYRYGDIIPWDHDVDIAILFDDHDRAFKALNAGLDKSKYVIQDWSSYKEPGCLLKLYMKESGTYMDLYHYKVDSDTQKIAYFFGHNDCLFLRQQNKNVENAMIGPLPIADMFPLKKAKIGKVDVFMPNATETFLQSKYGKNLDPSRVWNEEKQKYEKVPGHPYWDDHEK